MKKLTTFGMCMNICAVTSLILLAVSCSAPGGGSNTGGGGGGGTQNITYTVAYDGNGATGGTVPIDGSGYQQGATVTVIGNTGTLVKNGFTWTGWNTQANGSGTGFAAGTTFTMSTSNVTLYALWTISPYVAGEYNGGPCYWTG
jgi:uncharacterized repeat protein (TIGR02543 family)